MLVPIFSRGPLNTPFVQSMDRYCRVEEFFPYYQAEEFDLHYENETVIVEVGGDGLIAFREAGGSVWRGVVSGLVSYVDSHQIELDGAPLLKLQILRLIDAPLAQQYEVWRSASDRYFSRSSQKSHWLDAELLGYQNNGKIWNLVEAKKEKSKVERPSLAGRLDSLDAEVRLEFLSEHEHFEYSDWDIEWFKLRDQLPADERVYLLANEWLYVMSGGGKELGRAKRVLAEMLRYWRSVPGYDAEFVDFLAELIRSGELFSDELGVSFHSLMAAIDIVERGLSDEDYISLLIVVLGDHYFSQSQTEEILMKLERAAQPRRVLAAELWPAFATSQKEEVVIVESWKDVAARYQDVLRSAFDRLSRFSPETPALRTFEKKWKPLLKVTEGDG